MKAKFRLAAGSILFSVAIIGLSLRALARLVGFIFTADDFLVDKPM